MASKHLAESFTEEVICPICHDFFSDPVILECEHNFCRRCLTQRCEREETKSCPECRQKIAERTLRPNRVLGSLAEKARELKLTVREKERKVQCDKHKEELKLFCESDKKLICVICAAAPEHRGHRFLPINEAIETYKNRVKSSLESLIQKQSAFQDMEQKQKQKLSGLREQSHSLQSHIKSLFADLRQMLFEKEQSLLRDLMDEEARILSPIETNIRRIQENLNSIQEKVSKLQKRMDQQDSLIFLKEEANRKRRISEDDHVLSLLNGALSDKKFNHAILLNTLLSEAFDFIKEASVTLDVETAASRLEVSEDRKMVRWTRTQRSLPDTGKRFTVQACVLGSEGFTSGRHYWEVQVLGNRRWSLGVAAESVERKGLVRLRPETGAWTIGQKDDRFYVHTSSPFDLPGGSIPGRVGVYLSYETGTVSFYRADTKSHLHTFTGNKFPGKLYPFFRTVDGNWLKICSGSPPHL